MCPKWIEYTVTQCTDTPNYIFIIKQGGLGKTLEVYTFRGFNLQNSISLRAREIRFFLNENMYAQLFNFDYLGGLFGL